MKEIAQAVRIGARAYLKRQYMGVSIFFVVVFFILLYWRSINIWLSLCLLLF